MRNLLLFIFLPLMVQAEVKNFPIRHVIFNANIVASACHVRVDADGIGNNLLTFATYNKSTMTAVAPSLFTINLFESGASIQGCSAFRVGQIATLQFGNPGQTDAAGVITRGAGDGVRIVIRAADNQADWRESITSEHDAVNYPVDFAVRGLFRFTAQPIFPAGVRAGEYDGVLSFVVTYQ